MTEQLMNGSVMVERPLVTFLLVAFNQEQYIREAIEGALSQTYSPLQIIISDDCSQDHTYVIIEEMAAQYKGGHQIILNRNPINLGIGSHINKLMELAKGDLIVAAAGDDISMPERTEKLANYFFRHDRCMSLFTNMVVIDEFGNQHGNWVTADWVYPVQTLVQRCLNGAASVFGCTHAWRKHVFDAFGPLDSSVVHEDIAIPFRSTLIGTVDYIDVSLVYYRRHRENVCLTAENQIRHKDKRKFHAAGMVGVRKTMLNDFMLHIKNVNSANRKFISEITSLEKGLSSAEFEYNLISCNTFVCQLKHVVKGIWDLKNIKVIIRFALIEYFPRIYLWRVQSRSNANQFNL